jgi:hypothetical protein
MQETSTFLELWNEYLTMGAIGAAVLGFVIFLFHEIRQSLIRDPKVKYDYVNQNEIKFFWYSVVLYAVAILLFLNTLAPDKVEVGGPFWFFARIFGSICLALIFGVIFQNILQVYYPTYVEKKLQLLRHKPRVSAAGNVMRLLSEDEEDAYLDEGMQAEEAAHVVDYDVWLDEATGQTKIEKYDGHKHAEQCGDCNYFTLKVVREEVIKSATESEPGELLAYYQCTYCGHKEKRYFTVGKREKATA